MRARSSPCIEAQRCLEMLPERVVVCSPDGHICWANSLAETFFGMPRSEIEGRRLDELCVVDEAPSAPLLDHLHGLPRGEGVDGVVRHGSGAHIRVELATSGFFDGLAAVVLRPTRPAAAASATTARIYELVFEGAPVGIFHFDAAGAITACNDAFVRILGSPRRMLLGVRLDTLPDPVMRRCMLDALSGKRSRYEGEYKSATSGQVRSVRVDYAPVFGEDGVVIGGVGITEDVTDRSRAEEASRRSIESFRSLIERAPDAIAVHREGRFVLVNPMLVRLLSYESDAELLGQPVEQVLHPDEIKRYRASIAEAPGPEDSVYLQQVRLRGAHGEMVTTEIASINIDFEGGPAILSFARDVTERRVLDARLAKTNRLASIGTLAAGVAHEINNPLAYVMLNLNLLARRNLDDSARGALDLAREGCERVRLIVRDLGIFSRAEEDRRVWFDVRQAIASALNLAGTELRSRARLVCDTPPVPLVLGDEARLGQVILNLVLNAAQAIPEGAPDAHTITVATAARNGCVEIRVSDTGVGIPKKMLEHIFEPFWTTKPVGVGTGLGLWIVHGIVQAHGGSVEVESEPGMGSTFRVLLPAGAQATPTSRPPPVTVDAPPGRILLIDDERRFVEALRAGLAPHHQVILETSGAAGFERLLAESFDLVVCDLMMPGMNGMTILHELERSRPDLIRRFVLMTGGAYGDEPRALFERLGVRVLEKPFDFSAVEALMADTQRRS